MWPILAPTAFKLHLLHNEANHMFKASGPLSSQKKEVIHQDKRFNSLVQTTAQIRTTQERETPVQTQNTVWKLGGI